MGEDQLDDLKRDGPIRLSVFDRIAWDFTLPKWKMQWKTVKCCDFISSCYSHNPHGKAGNKEDNNCKPAFILKLILNDQCSKQSLFQFSSRTTHVHCPVWVWAQFLGCKLVAERVKYASFRKEVFKKSRKIALPKSNFNIRKFLNIGKAQILSMVRSQVRWFDVRKWFQVK